MAVKTVERDPFIRSVAETIDRFDLLPPGTAVVVAVSGGPDSTALLAALAALAPGRGYRLVAAHLDHGLRPDSAGDARFAGQQARRFGAEFIVERCDVAGLARRWRTSVEDAGRRARYRFLRQVAARHGCTRIAVGHHRDDQVETVLMNLLTGAGPDGIAGMRPRRGSVVRPLWERRRQEILDFLRRRELVYRIDASNVDPGFMRNRVRHQLLPLLRRQYNPRIDDALWRLSQLAAAEVDYLEERAARLFREARLHLPGGIWLDAAALREAPVPLRRRAIRRAYWQAAAGPGEAAGDAGVPEAAGAGGEPDRAAGGRALGLRHVEAVEALLDRTSGAVDLPGGVRAAHQQGRLLFRPAAPRAATRTGAAGSGAGPAGSSAEPAAGGAPGPEPRPLPVPGRIDWEQPWGGIGAEVLEGGAAAPGDLRRPGHAYLDYEKMGSPAALWVRAWRPGDRMRPLGAPGSRKLQDLFVDRRVPRDLRGRVPLVTLGDTILWVPGVAVAHDFRVTGGSRRLLHLFLTEAEPGVLR
ncbi:MAG: tRNA lysidine(34) synthetase TilS [Bacillota bacterium]